MAGGRPTKYDPKTHISWGRALAELGRTNEQIAEEFGVSGSTLDLWIAEHEEFSGAIRLDKELADGKVERSLYELATGYNYNAKKPMVVSSGHGLGSSIEMANYTEHVPPNISAIVFWLTNRQRAKWKRNASADDASTVLAKALQDLIDPSAAKLKPNDQG